METPASNTYVFDPENPTEMARLINQERMITNAMNGPLSGIAASTPHANILDLGCGPGGWVLDVAFELPDAEVEGVDVSRIMVDYANARARTQRLPNASFGVMDITKPLDFPDASFDIVNARLLFAVLKRDAWPPFLDECTRVLRPGGLLRLTEVVDLGITSSAIANQFMALTAQAIWQAGYGFAPEIQYSSIGMIHMLPHLLRQRGHQQIRLQGHAYEYSAGCDAWPDQYHNIEIIGYQLKPLILKTGLITSEAWDHLHQQALIEMMKDTFYGVAHLTTVLGQKSSGS